MPWDFSKGSWLTRPTLPGLADRPGPAAAGRDGFMASNHSSYLRFITRLQGQGEPLKAAREPFSHRDGKCSRRRRRARSRSILGAWASCWRLGLQSVPEGDLQSWSPQESSHPPRGRPSWRRARVPVQLDWPRQSREGKHGDPAPNLLATVPVRGSLPPWPTLPDCLPGQFCLPGSTSIFKQVCSWQPSM